MSRIENVGVLSLFRTSTGRRLTTCSHSHGSPCRIAFSNSALTFCSLLAIFVLSPSRNHSVGFTHPGHGVVSNLCTQMIKSGRYPSNLPGPNFIPARRSLSIPRPPPLQTRSPELSGSCPRPNCRLPLRAMDGLPITWQASLQNSPHRGIFRTRFNSSRCRIIRTSDEMRLSRSCPSGT